MKSDKDTTEPDEVKRQAFSNKIHASLPQNLTGRTHMMEKYSSPLSYLWAGATTAIGILTLEEWVAVVGIVCTIGTFLLIGITAKGI
ncbi:HP1 family phage holin [Arsenophonus nasoniae]|uniref:HP1 family phage holin n=1 Tax=Arsenophonus nasoniae TaxID=638 RepID=UPI001FE4EB2E|nr:HP1 family phage holin [Arsenophonus nasoniae]